MSEAGYRPTPYPIEEVLTEAFSALPPPEDKPSKSFNWDDPEETAQKSASEGDDTQKNEGVNGSVLKGTLAKIDSESHVCAQETPAKEALSEHLDIRERLQNLARWQVNFVLALMEFGGVIGLACTRLNVSRWTVDRAMANNPEFATAVHEAIQHSTDLVEGAVYRGATIGDLRGKWHQGILVGHERVRNTADAELLLKIRGRGGKGGTSDQADTGKVSLKDVPELVTDIMARLYAMRTPPKTIDMEE